MGLATASLILAGVGTGISAFGQWKAGKAEKARGEAEQRASESMADLSEYNAAVSDVLARDAAERGELEVSRFRVRTRALIGEQRADYAAGNIDVGFGSAVDVQADTAFLGELDALTARTNAAREAWGFRVEATDQRKRADIQRKEGASAFLAGKERQAASRLGAIGTIVVGGASLLETRYGFGRGGRG